MAKRKKKVALVTGASSGIGKAIARKLLKDGLTVIVAARRVEMMKDLADAGADVLSMDVSKEESIQAAVDHIATTYGGVDVLVNNAGFGLYGAVEDIPLDDARYQFEVNVFGGVRLTQLLLPYMRDKKAGKIFFVTSIGGKIFTPLGAWYHATKHALEGFADCLRMELLAHKIDVVIVEPGLIQTEFGDEMSGHLKKYSMDGAYAALAKNIARASEDSYQDGVGTSPDVIAKVVSQATKSRRPKTRYAAGKYSTLLLFMRKWFSDRLFQRVVMSMAR